MAFGTNKGERRPVVFLDLRTKASDPDGVGFRQVLNKTANPDPAGPKWLLETAMHQFVEGRITGFKVKEEDDFEDKTIKHKVGNLRISDTPVNGQEAGPDVIVKFRLDGQHGRKLVGLIANALVTNIPAIHIKTNRAEAGETIGTKVLEKPQAFVTANVGDAHGQRIKLPYYIDSATGAVRMNGEAVAELPRGVEMMVNKKKVYDFSAADAWVEETAEVLQSFFSVPAEEHVESDGGDDNIDLDEAAAAAAPAA